MKNFPKMCWERQVKMQMTPSPLVGEGFFFLSWRLCPQGEKEYFPIQG